MNPTTKTSFNPMRILTVLVGIFLLALGGYALDLVDLPHYAKLVAAGVAGGTGFFFLAFDVRVK